MASETQHGGDPHFTAVAVPAMEESLESGSDQDNGIQTISSRNENLEATMTVAGDRVQEKGIVDIREISGTAMETFRSVLESAGCPPTDLRLLVIGRTGQGKSALINSIIELKNTIAKEESLRDNCTDKIQQYFYSDVISGVNVTLIDTPGLQDIRQEEQKYIQKMKSECREVSLVFYCMKITEHRAINDDVHAVKKLHQAFGPKFWERVVFVLTFANEEDCERKDARDKHIVEDLPIDDEATQEEMSTKIFFGRVKYFAKEEKGFLKKHIHINPNIVDKIHFIPAGFHTPTRKCVSPDLFRRDWLKKLLRSSCQRIKFVHKFTKLNLNDKIHFAIIIDNDGAVTIDKHGQVTKLNDQAATMKEALERLGFCVLYFNSLSSESIACLLDAFQHVDHSELAAFALVILSKGSTCHLYDANNTSVAFEEVSEHFKSTEELPKLFFFHMASDADAEASGKLDCRLNLSNSIALAISINYSGHEISPAVVIFEKILSEKSCQTLKVCFTEIKDELGSVATCAFENTLCDNFVLPSPFEPITEQEKSSFSKKQTQLCRTMWRQVRYKTVDVLREGEMDVMDIVRTERYGSLFSSAISATGGALVIAGIGLVPFTFGISLSLSAVGTGVGFVGGSGGVLSFLYSIVMSNSRLRAAKDHINFDQQFSGCVNVKAAECTEANETRGAAEAERTSFSVKAAEYTEVNESYGTKFFVDSTQAAVSFVRAGINLVTQAADDAIVAAGRIAGTTAARTAGRVIGNVVAAVAVPVDIGHIIYNVYLLNKASKDKSGKSDSNETIKWFVKQIEEMFKSICIIIDEKKYDFKAGQTDTFDNSDNGYKVLVPVTSTKSDAFAVRTILSGPFHIPKGATLVSAVYDVLVEEKLQAPVTIEIEHCVDITDQSTAVKMTFAKATVDFDKKVFVFTPLEGGTFPQGQTHGSISLSDSSLLCILYYSESLQDQLMMKYAAQCSLTGGVHKCWKKNITFTKCLSAHRKYVQMEAGSAIESSPFKFTSDTIVLADFKSEKREHGWIISPCDIPDKISKEKLDEIELLSDFRKSDIEMFPSLSFDIQVEDEKKASDELNASIKVKGTDLELNIFVKKEQNEHTKE